MKTIYFILLVCLLFAASCHNRGPVVKQRLPAVVDFNFHIKPILSDRCYKCHGPDENTREAGLRLDIKEGAFAMLDSIERSHALVAGDLNNSLLFQRIRSDDPDFMMPPPDSKLEMSEYEVSLVKKWIDQGAEWKPHWAFIPPRKSKISKISTSSWIKNPIDYWVLEGMKKLGLKPSPESSKAKLLRRVSFDLRGLPPTLDEIEAFVKDNSADALENVIDQFLSEKSYGERMAMEWLDLARYADSHGYQDDLERSMWPWRDWVIDAYNDNMTYDQFVTWQLAGDLLPDATYEQKLATGFNRNHKITQEVGVINEEYRVNYVLDRVNTFSTVFLGLTAECAQCHDHKFDPISQKEYFSLFSFFNNVPEKGRVEYGIEVAEPFLPLPIEKTEEIRGYVDKLVENDKTDLKSYVNSKWQEYDMVNSESNRSDDHQTLSVKPRAWYSLDHEEPNGMVDLIEGRDIEEIKEAILVPGKYAGGLDFIGNNYLDLGSSPGVNFNAPFSIAFWIKDLDGGISGPIITSANHENQVGLSIQISGEKHFVFSMNNHGNDTRLRMRSKEPIPSNAWTYFTLSYDGSRSSSGVKMFMNGHELDTYVFNDNLRGRIDATSHLYLGTSNPHQTREYIQSIDSSFFTFKPNGLVSGRLDEIMFFDQVLTQREITLLLKWNPLSDIVQKESKTTADIKRLFYDEIHKSDPQFQGLTNRLRASMIKQHRLENIVIRPTMIMAELDTVRPTYVLDRGQYDAPTEEVQPGTPLSVLSYPEYLPVNRLGLSKWLFDPTNPLTARVAVNRIWQMIFTRGIVDTPEDFGNQGSLPSHPELLDWLAVEFVESGWDIAHMIKLIMTSATYRQSVAANSKSTQLDLENVYLSRGPQARLPAEMIRDQALFLGGLLNSTVGGPSVRPYQPEGLWLEVASGNQSLRKYIADHGQDLYRRSLYTFWKRSLPPPSMLIFDAPSREQCITRRKPTNTPMQALVLLNDPQFTEASRMMATSMLSGQEDSPADRIEFMFRSATSRIPTKKEISVLSDLFHDELSTYKEDPMAAEQYLSIGELPVVDEIEAQELAAYTTVASTILNLTETISK